MSNYLSNNTPTDDELPVDSNVKSKESAKVIGKYDALQYFK